MNNAFFNGISRPWNIHAGSFVALALRTLSDTNATATSLSGWRERFSQFVPQREEMKIDANGIAHVSVHGALFNKETQSYFELFKNHVLTHREISKDSMRGQAFVGNVALKNNLIDEICDRNSAYAKLEILTRG